MSHDRYVISVPCYASLSIMDGGKQNNLLGEFQKAVKISMYEYFDKLDVIAFERYKKITLAIIGKQLINIFGVLCYTQY